MISSSRSAYPNLSLCSLNRFVRAVIYALWATSSSSAVGCPPILGRKVSGSPITMVVFTGRGHAEPNNPLVNGMQHFKFFMIQCRAASRKLLVWNKSDDPNTYTGTIDTPFRMASLTNPFLFVRYTISFPCSVSNCSSIPPGMTRIDMLASRRPSATDLLASTQFVQSENSLTTGRRKRILADSTLIFGAMFGTTVSINPSIDMR
mmetsp:Transcript_12447/g.18707  ORF Transcript_12447/g.18707 Transcript_12447/m.18707 type:complete len:205 (-) Transcript_12447:471-1085(-)